MKGNTVIYLKGVNYEELRSIVNFIYLGGTKVKQVNFPNFMQIAQELDIKGLAVNQETQKKEEKKEEEREEERGELLNKINSDTQDAIEEGFPDSEETRFNFEEK